MIPTSQTTAAKLDCIYDASVNVTQMCMTFPICHATDEIQLDIAEENQRFPSQSASRVFVRFNTRHFKGQNGRVSIVGARRSRS
jgi:hypothetical protein